MDKEQISKGMREENIEKTNITNEEISGYSTQYISEKWGCALGVPQDFHMKSRNYKIVYNAYKCFYLQFYIL